MWLSTSSSSFNNTLRIVPSALVTIGITIVFLFYSLFISRTRSRYSSLFSVSFNYTVGMVNFTLRHVLIYLLNITRSSRLAEIRWSVYISKSQRSLSVSFSRNVYYYYSLGVFHTGVSLLSVIHIKSERMEFSTGLKYSQYSSWS